MSKGSPRTDEALRQSAIASRQRRERERLITAGEGGGGGDCGSVQTAGFVYGRWHFDDEWCLHQ